MAERKSFLIRIDGEMLDHLRRWADDDFRSLNAQIEFLLRRALAESGRLKRSPGGEPASD
ncbi:MAG: Arc family DNA-binding protein [Bryobacteraceae bacterium]